MARLADRIRQAEQRLATSSAATCDADFALALRSLTDEELDVLILCYRDDGNDVEWIGGADLTEGQAEIACSALAKLRRLGDQGARPADRSALEHLGVLASRPARVRAPYNDLSEEEVDARLVALRRGPR